MYLQCWHGWCHMKLQPSRHKFCVHHTTMHHVILCKATSIHKVYECLAVTCHLNFWQNGRGLLRVTAVTRGWNGYRNKSQRRKLTPEKKILQPLLQRLKPSTFRSRVWRSNHWAIPAPNAYDCRHRKGVYTGSWLWENQHTRELISARMTSHKHNNKNRSHPR